MIGKLKGRIDSFGTDWLIIDVAGVGYHVFCSSKTLAALPSVGEFAELHTEMLVSQDMIRLVGFASVLEREWFRLLQTVQGVGTRVALAILSTLSASEIANAIALQDKPMIGRAPGVGKKLAERIVLELKDKAPAFTGADATLPNCRRSLRGHGPRRHRMRCPPLSIWVMANHKQVPPLPPPCARMAMISLRRN